MARTFYGPKCYRNATHTKIVRPFYVRSKELMMGIRHPRLGWLGVESAVLPL